MQKTIYTNYPLLFGGMALVGAAQATAMIDQVFNVQLASSSNLLTTTIAGIGIVIYSVFDNNKIERDLQTILGYDNLRVLKKNKCQNGYTFVLNLPTGMCESDFLKKSEQIEQYFNADININYKNKRIIMELKTNKLDDFIDFETLNIKQKQNEIYIGDSIDGQVYWDYKRYPHALVGGGTGSGKTTFLLSLLTLLHQEKIKPEIHLIDFKGAELSLFKYSWLVKSFSKTKSDFAKTLNKLTQESTRRFELFAQNNVRNMYIYNEKSNTKLKHIFVVIDEFAVLEGEKDIQQELQMRVALDRAAGIHYIITTQSPRHQVVSGMLKANLELRLVFRTFNDLDSQILFDEKGAEKLKGNGEALFKTNKIVKIQCPFVSEATVEKAIKKYILKKETPVIQSNVQNKPKYPQKNKSIEQKDKIENPQKNKPKGVIKLC